MLWLSKDICMVCMHIHIHICICLQERKLLDTLSALLKLRVASRAGAPYIDDAAVEFGYFEAGWQAGRQADRQYGQLYVMWEVGIYPHAVGMANFMRCLYGMVFLPPELVTYGESGVKFRSWSYHLNLNFEINRCTYIETKNSLRIFVGNHVRCSMFNIIFVMLYSELSSYHLKGYRLQNGQLWKYTYRHVCREYLTVRTVINVGTHIRHFSRRHIPSSIGILWVQSHERSDQTVQRARPGDLRSQNDP